MLKIALACSLAFLLGGCAVIPTPQERQAHADALTAAQGWQSQRIASGRFELIAYLPRDMKPAQTLSIYIEGDGFAWLAASTPSADPTPREPLALKLALAHPEGNAVYLARPCQYVDAARTGCAQRYWTEQRFAPEVVAAMDEAVNILKARTGATRLMLVGYSGGGNIAALLAARRPDVARLVTVAGNLDHAAWTAHHRVDSLSGSLNASATAEQLAGLPQTHFIGARDRVIPPALAQHWPVSMAGPRQSNLRIIADFDHTCCWAERWPGLAPKPD